VDPKQFPHALEVREMLVDVESCEQHNKLMQKEEKKRQRIAQ